MKHMKKKNLKPMCNIINIILIMTFVIKTIINFNQYDEMTNSAPFYVWIITNALYLLLPALIIFIIGYISNK